MKGHIRERSPGHWAIVIDVRDPYRQAQAQVAFVRRDEASGAGTNRPPNLGAAGRAPGRAFPHHRRGFP
jgi:hypothetical protein